MIIGVDVSHWQARISHQKLKNFGIAFGIAKAGQYYNGSEYDDDKFSYNTEGFEAVGIPHSMYYFYHPAVGDDKQARHFEKLWKLHEQDFPPVLDCECDDKLGQYEIQRRTKNMLEKMEEIAGVRPIIYTSPGFWGSYVGNPVWSDGYKFWVAQYPKLTSTLFKNAIMHQFTDKGAVPGCPTVDLNYWLGTEEEFRKFTKKEITIQQIEENRIKNKFFALSRANRQWLENVIK